MKKILGLLLGVALLASVSMVWADEAAKTEAVAKPAAATTPMAKSKAKKAKKKAAVKKAASTWYCSMGDYSGPKTADGKCPNCGMALIEKK